MTRLLDYNLLESLHIAAVALWLGTDIAAAVALRRAIGPAGTTEGRSHLLGLWADLDLGPRSASIVLLTLGITLTYLGRWGFTAASELVILGGSVVLGGLWILSVAFRFWVDHPRPDVERSRWQVRTASGVRTADLWLRVVITLALVVAAGLSLRASGGPIAASWLSLKLILVAVAIALTFGTRFFLRVLGVSPDGAAESAWPSSRVRWYLVLGATAWVCIVVVIWLSVAKI